MKRLATVLIALGALVALATPAGATNGPHVTPGTPFEAAAWTRWAFGTPTPGSSIADPANCNVAQQGYLRFLAPATDTGQSTACTIPAGSALVVSPGGGVATRAGGDGSTIRQLLQVASATADDITGVSVTLDGVPITAPRLRAPVPFVLRLPADNVLGAPAGITAAAVDGFFVTLRNLSVGHHVVTVSDTFISDGSTLSLTADVTVTRMRAPRLTR
jgi:hypothetical protein